MTPRDWLYGLELHGIKLGLENISHLLERSGHPERRYPTVHVAGSNGKGSVLAFLDAMLCAAGYRTGRFSSPHLCRLNERFLTAREPVGDAALDETLAYYQELSAEMSPPPTFFEINTAVAYTLIAQAGVDVGLIEVGLGGRFDSTNTLAPLVTAITNIGLEHTQYLGDTIEKIAFEKAGIVKAGVPLAVGKMAREAEEVILQRAAELRAPVRLAGRDFRWSTELSESGLRFTCTMDRLEVGPVALGLPGAYQAENAAVAVALAEELRKTFPRLTPEAIEQGLEDASWPCRLERVLDDPPLIVDVAHNAAGARALAGAMDGGSIVVLAVSSDKNARDIVTELAPKTHRFVLTEFANRRRLELDALKRAAEGLPHDTAGDVPSAIRRAIELSEGRRTIYVAGSLFTAGEARAFLEDEYGAPPMRF